MFSMRRSIVKGHDNERGSILVLSLLVLSILVILSGGILSMAVNEGRHTTRSISSLSAINLAEAGADYAIWEMNYNGGNYASGDGWSGTNPITRTANFQTAAGDTVGEYYISVTNPGTSSVVVEVTGYVPSQSAAQAQRTVQVGLEVVADSTFSMAAFGVNSVTLDSHVETDSYTSTDGPYGGENVSDQGDIGTDSISSGALTIDSDESEVNGDATIGPGGDVGVAISADEGAITGDELVSDNSVNPVPEDAPTGLPARADITGSITISADGEYSSIDAGSESVITIDSDVTLYVTDTFHLDQNSNIDVINGATVKIYLGNASFSLDQGAAINDSGQDPAKFGVYGTSAFVGTIQIDQNGTFYGTIHAPAANVQLDQNTAIYGAIIANAVQMDENVAVHFDEALLSSSGGGGGGYTVSYWQEK